MMKNIMDDDNGDGDGDDDGDGADDGVRVSIRTIVLHHLRYTYYLIGPSSKEELINHHLKELVHLIWCLIRHNKYVSASV